VNDPDKITWPNGNGISDYLPDRLWTYNEFTADGETAAEVTWRLASLKFITSALRRRAKFWCITAVVGLIVGCGIYLKSPPGYQAATTVWLVPGPYENIDTAANNDQAMAQTRTVAGLAVQQLGLRESGASFLATYQVTPVTERVIDITAKAHSSRQALLNAGAVATAFLKFRADEMEAQQAAVLASLDHQAQQVQQRLNSIDTQIKQIQAQATSSAQQSQLKNLLDEKTQAENSVYQYDQAAFSDRTSNGAATEAAANASYVLDPPILLVHSRLKPLIYDVGVGLVGGLFLGMIIVVVGALASDRLRRRDDVAQALGAPVRLSVGTAGRRRWRPVRGGSASEAADVRQIAAHLRRSVPESSRAPARLAVVPVDDLNVPAQALVSLAASCAREGKHVVVADLCQGRPAARLLGITDPGVHTVSGHDARLVLAVPERDDLAPVGPLDRGLAAAQRSSFTQAVADACASANLLLALVTVDPSFGGDHLATWATDAIAVVTGGRSSAEKIHGVAELIRLSGTRLVSAVLTGADKTDESLGVISAPETVLGG
jgi:capsular polysaccharide biosynthesis protein